MSIETFIQREVFAPRLAKRAVLVVYDPARRYRDLCLGMAEDKRIVVDASDSSILAREAASLALVALGQGRVQQLLVYVPAAAPVDDEARTRDPFAAVAACGAVFPDGDSDSFESICLRSKPDQATAIRKIFAADPGASFAVINAVGGGLGWPNLRTLLGAESARDILLALLAPSAAQESALKQSDAWVVEAKDLLKTSLGLALRTRGKTWSALADELWTYLLFSEFVLDLPETLPSSLVDMPCAPVVARPIVEGLCDTLRNDQRTRGLYVDRAEKIESELNLVAQCAALTDLGQRDTFPFEERTFLQRAIKAYQSEDVDTVRQVLALHERSVWTIKGESRARWDLMRSALELTLACASLEQQLSDHSQDMDRLLKFYVGSLREADRLHREFEQTVSDFDWQDTHGLMSPIQRQARRCYGKLVERAQLVFTRHLASVGWPMPNYLANSEVFDRIVAPKLQNNGHRVAYLMIDALRFELGVALERQLVEDGAVELRPALAQLPTVTPVGMASLLPGASQLLYLKNNDGSVVPMLGDQSITTVAQRMEVFRRRYGQRFAECRLEEFVRGRVDFSDETDLLVLRAVEIDSHFENHPDTAPTEITNALKRIRMAIHRLRERKFDEVVIATDHGFFMNTHAGAGDTCAKPAGTWVPVHDRCALGDGQGDSNHITVGADKVGIRGDFTKFATPLSLAAYRNGLLYYHGGASLQECVVPVIIMQLRQPEQPKLQQARVTLQYKNGSKRIATRVPVIDLAVDAADMFAADSAFEIQLEAQNSKGDTVGEAKAGGAVNAATGTVTLRAGEKVQVTLKMHLEFEGKFKVKAMNPKTQAIYAQIDLETDYTV